MTVKRNLAVGPTLVSIAVPYAEPLPERVPQLGVASTNRALRPERDPLLVLHRRVEL